MNSREAHWLMATLFAVIGVSTALMPDWLEIAFRIDPDHGSGAVEWTITIACGLLALAFAATASLRQFRANRQTAAAASK